MPSIKIKSRAGPLSINYTIATPKNASAKTIDKTLPTILFLHPVYLAQEIYQNQFNDARLRRFNLVVLDLRGHGETGGRVPTDYTRVDAAEEVAKFIEALKLPKVHLFGISMGACIAVQTTILHPEKVLSLLLISPLGMYEPPDVALGRREIFDYWCEGFSNPKEINKEALADSIFGALQLGFNGQDSSLIHALTTRTLPFGLKNWAPKHFDDFETISVRFFTERKPFALKDLGTIKVPIKLIHCTADIAYPLPHFQEFQEVMEGVGANVSVNHVEGAAHFGNVTHGPQINRICHDFIMSQSGEVPPPLTNVVTAWEPALMKAGYRPNDEDSDDDDL